MVVDVDKIVKLILEELEDVKREVTVHKDTVSLDHPHEAQGIPIGVSNRHVHLNRESLEILFGEGAELTKTKDLSQPGQYACQERVTLVGPKGILENVTIIGPVRKETQVEILMSDCFKLGVSAPLKLSGDLENSVGICICGPRGCQKIDSGVIVAKRHIHMTPSDANRYQCHDNQIVTVKCEGERGGILDHVVIRVSDSANLDCHLDIEEANCMGLSNQNKVVIIK